MEPEFQSAVGTSRLRCAMWRVRAMKRLSWTVRLFTTFLAGWCISTIASFIPAMLSDWLVALYKVPSSFPPVNVLVCISNSCSWKPKLSGSKRLNQAGTSYFQTNSSPQNPRRSQDSTWHSSRALLLFMTRSSPRSATDSEILLL
ncbi:hypothetical protein BJX66DRAFT_291428 [Aspergillus keveii]|uniref:Uncharacterized protein n=1 Tax=Aspergillus keveii TaxID=714993 RepID=A0ABR4GM74_9EURO